MSHTAKEDGMIGRLVGGLAVAVLVAAPAALADGPLFATVGDPGVLTRDGATRYVAVTTSTGTVLERIATHGGHVLATLPLRGFWGTASVGYGPTSGQGLSHDGRTLVLAHTSFPVAPSPFVVLDPRTLRVRDRIVLKGRFAFDALSPDASRLYVIQMTNGGDGHYVVRAYDMRTHRLLPGRIADKTQRSWLMEGFATTRVTSPDGRWVYTLYMNPGGYPFVHALDTIRGVAHCIGVPLTDQSGITNLVLRLRGSQLAIAWHDGRVFRTIDTGTWRMSRPVALAAAAATSNGTPYAALAGAAAFAALGAAGLLLLRRRHRAAVRTRLA
jgi:hypothetical protein